jgi:hypothetical protein
MRIAECGLRIVIAHRRGAEDAEIIKDWDLRSRQYAVDTNPQSLHLHVSVYLGYTGDLVVPGVLGEDFAAACFCQRVCSLRAAEE